MKTALAALCLASLGAAPPAASTRPVRVFDARTPMGTYMAITVYAADEAEGQRAIAAAFERVEEVEAATSTYRDQSDVSKLNRAAGGPPIPVSAHLWTVLQRSAEVSAETDGAFDATAGPLVSLWRRTWKKGKRPTEAETAAARALVDHRSVRLLADPPRAQLLKPGMHVDLGGIGKGYAADQAIAVLRAHGIEAAMADAGGNIYALGAPPERQGWLIGIRDPARPGKILPRPLLLRDCAVSTSGDYEQFGTVDGHRYSHILDPRTGQPVEGMTSVTVVAKDATIADGLSTAFSVLGPQAALAFAEKHAGVEVMVIHSHQGQSVTDRSKGFERLEVTVAADR